MLFVNQIARILSFFFSGFFLILVFSIANAQEQGEFSKILEEQLGRMTPEQRKVYEESGVIESMREADAIYEAQRKQHKDLLLEEKKQARQKSSGNFFRGNQCDVLSAWVKPLQQEFPEISGGGNTEYDVAPKFKLLYGDDYFIPYFGKPIDKFTKSEKKKIYKALDWANRKCVKKGDKDREFLIAIYPGIFLNHPFITKGWGKHTFSYEYVVNHAQARRKALHPLGLKAGQQPSASQLYSVASQNPTLFSHLWPSEKQAIIDYEQTGSTHAGERQQIQSIDIDDPAGEWSGLAQCGRSYKKVSLKIHRKPGRIQGVMNINYSDFEFTLHPLGKGLFEIASDRKVFGKHAKIRRSKDTPPYIKMDVAGGCSRVVAIRFDKIPGIGGRYSQSQNQSEFCANVVEDWLYKLPDRINLAKYIKEDFYPALNSYDVVAASKSSLFGKKLINHYFGSSWSSLNSNEFNKLERQISGCLVLRKLSKDDYHLGEFLYTRDSLSKLTKQLFNRKDVELGRLVRTDLFDKNINNRTPNDRNNSPEQIVQNWQSHIGSESAINRFLSERAQKLSLFDPELTDMALKPIKNALSKIKNDKHRSNTGDQRAKYSALLKSADIPYSDLEKPFRRVLEGLANGETVHMDDGTMLFMGGLAHYFLDKCSSSLSTAQRMPIAQFTVSSAQRAAFGNDYSNTDIGKSMQKQVSGQTIFRGGLTSANIIGCQGADPILKIVGDVIRSNETDADGGTPLFVRSCAPEHGEEACQCLAKVATAAIPNIHQQRYTRSTIPRLIKMNPLIGIQIYQMCGIINY